MWRITLLLCLICSLILNVYLFLRLEIDVIEANIKSSQDVLLSASPQNRVTKTNNKILANDVKGFSNDYTIHSTMDIDFLAKIKSSIDSKEYVNAKFLSNTYLIQQGTEKPNETIIALLAEIKEYWLNNTKMLIEKAMFIDAENSINVYLEFQADDVDFLYQHVELLLQQQLIELAIKHAYEVQYHVFDELKKTNVISLARNLVQQEANKLIKGSKWQELQLLVEQVIILDPDDLNLLWLFARAQYELGEYELARDVLTPLLEQPNYKVKANALLAKIESALKAPENIALSRQGEHFIVEALINNDVDVSLMLDTGASISLLSEPAFITLSQYSEVNYIEDIQMTTAGGVVVASLYQVDEVSIQGYVVKDFIFAVTNFVNERNDGLLGMNFLKQFDFHIDQTNSVLTLKTK